MRSRSQLVTDSHSLIWYVQTPGRLSRRALHAFDFAQRVFIPAICIWETALLAEGGKVRLGGMSPERWFEHAFEQAAFEFAGITPRVGTEAMNVRRALGLDPADQLIAATALALDLPLVTLDARLQAMARLETIW